MFLVALLACVADCFSCFSFLAGDHHLSELAASLLRRFIAVFKISYIYCALCMVHCQGVCCTYVYLCQCPAAYSQVFYY